MSHTQQAPQLLLPLPGTVWGGSRKRQEQTGQMKAVDCKQDPPKGRGEGLGEPAGSGSGEQKGVATVQGLPQNHLKCPVSFWIPVQKMQKAGGRSDLSFFPLFLSEV